MPCADKQQEWVEILRQNLQDGKFYPIYGRGKGSQTGSRVLDPAGRPQLHPYPQS